MSNAPMDDWCRRTVRIRGEDVPVWPRDQRISRLMNSVILMTRFTDVQDYHPGLTGRILQLEAQSTYKTDYELGGCGIKVYHVDNWQCPEAELIHQRVLCFYSQVFDCPEPVTDVSMANIYRNGDYCIPHSHIRTRASLVYCLAEGEPDPRHTRSGRLCITDPRLEVCCQEEPSRMTTPLVPKMPPGTLLLFPSEVVHFVTPYTGNSPRITMAWNIDNQPIPGDAIPGGLPPR